MALPDDDADKIGQDLSAEIERLAGEAMTATLADLAKGMAPRDAVAAAMRPFAGEFEALLAQSFSALLQRSIGSAEVRAMPVGAVPLSSRLYTHQQQTSAEVEAVIRTHAQGIHQARVLALQLYDGYDPKGAVDRPLEGRARAELPKALQALTKDAETRKSLETLIKRGQAQAARIKSPALRAGYTEAFDAWAAGKGEDALRRKMEVALKEKTRYMANRIAQTELARAHQAQVGAELMADEGVEVVQVLLNPAHPLRDICDLHAKANLFGLGAGNYPKAQAPQPPFHPHCWCRLRARRSLSGLVAREVDGGPAAWLRGLPVEDAARVMGSRERLQRVLNGEVVDGVLNEGKDRAYHLKRLGAGAGHPLVRENAGVSRSDALPRYAAAVIPAAKIAGYALNQEHEIGRHKARVFAAMLGITAAEAPLLEAAIRDGIRNQPTVKKHADKHGQRYEVDVPVTGPSGSAIVRTGWIVREDGGVPHLTSAYVKEKS